jgi:hypothetical protein
MHNFNLGGQRPVNIMSRGRQGPERHRLSPAQLQHIARTVHRTPEVMVKVLNRGGRSLGAVADHFNYLSRKGELEIETDEGERIMSTGAETLLLDHWLLDLDEDRRTADLKARGMRKPPKLVQKLVFSMPAGTRPEKVLTAVRNFAREEFALQHRYAMVLHTDQPHPHVHVVVKAMGDDGKRLNIRKETLRLWRGEFARHLRAQGVAANATPRQVRGAIKPPTPDGIYRAALRSASTHQRAREESVARELAAGQLTTESGKNRLLGTRHQVVRGWNAVAYTLAKQDQLELALAVRRFVNRMPPPRTEKEQIVEKWRELVREKSGARNGPMSRRSTGLKSLSENPANRGAAVNCRPAPDSGRRTNKIPTIQTRLDRSVVFLDRYFAVDRFDPFSPTGDGYRLVGCFLGVCGSMQPHDAVSISIDVNIPQARDVLGGKLRLNLGRDRRILDECLRMRTIRVRVSAGYRHDGSKQDANDHERRHYFYVHGIFLVFH